ncbi:CinA family nicotinamide mononucleotide deamidase-related protein [Chloroflexota bacterium]
MKAEIISIGTEILLGEITDTNASYLAGQLPLLGIDLYWVTQVGDNQSRLVEALERAWDRSDLIITSGGLGPTQDDITREAIAETAGEDMYVDPALESLVRDFFSRIGYEMPENNIRQAMLIPSARSIPNPLGTAPGWWLERGGKLLVAMPGPPREMLPMWEVEVFPKLKGKLAGEIILSRTLKTWGLSEAGVDEMVSSLLSSTSPTLAIYARADGIQLRITAKAPSEAEAQHLVSVMEERVRSVLGGGIWGADDDSLEGIAGELLRERGLTLATMEAFTGGLLASTINGDEASAIYFKGGLVSPGDEARIALGIDAAVVQGHGSAGAETAAAMAALVRSRLGADIGLGVGDLEQPSPGDSPTSTVHIAFDDGERKRSFAAVFPRQFPEMQRRITLAALFDLRRFLLEP